MHLRELRHNAEQEPEKVQQQGLLPEVGRASREEEEGRGDCGEELTIVRVLLAVVQLLPEGKLVVLPVVLERRALAPVQEEERQGAVHEVHVGPLQPVRQDEAREEPPPQNEQRVEGPERWGKGGPRRGKPSSQREVG